MDNKTFISRLAAKTGLASAHATALTASLAELIADHCCSLDTVAIPQFGSFSGRKFNESVVTNADGSRILLPPRIEIEFIPGAMLKKSISKK